MEAVQLQDFPECDRCVELQSERHDKPLLCPKCERQILPQLKQPGWARQIGFTHYTEEAEPEQTAPVAKAQRRNARKYGKLAANHDELLCHFCAGGCSTPVRSSGLMCGPCGEEKRSRRTRETAPRVHYTGLKSRVA